MIVVSSEKFIATPICKSEFVVELDKIYSAYSALKIKAFGEYKIELITAEMNGVSEMKRVIKEDKSENYCSNEYYGVGEYKLLVLNNSDSEIDIISDVISVCYPSEERGSFECSDGMLNHIYALGKHTVKICCQGIELDILVHQENLLCHGDYMIESMVNNYTTGDYSLTRFDILRASHYLYETSGYMHYVLEVVNKVGLFEKYGMELIRKWSVLVKDCEKGLRKVWTDYEGYEIDYSHGWGQLPHISCRAKFLKSKF